MYRKVYITIGHGLSIESVELHSGHMFGLFAILSTFN